MPPPSASRRRWWPWLLAIAVTWLVGVPAQAWTDVHVTRVEQLHLTSADLPRGTRLTVLQVTDFHDLRSVGQVEGLLAQARDLRPDVVALTGDFVHTDSPDLVMVERLVAGLRPLTPHVFFVRGNHDNWNASFGSHLDLEGLLRRYDVPILDNSHVTISGPFGQVEVLGTNDPFDGLDDLAAASAGADQSRFWLLLTHAPEIRDSLPGSGVDLALCGHTHGGQVRLPWVGAVFVPGQGRFPRYSRGLYDDWGGPLLWIDSGMGWTEPAVRFLAQSQASWIVVEGRG